MFSDEDLENNRKKLVEVLLCEAVHIKGYTTDVNEDPNKA